MMSTKNILYIMLYCVLLKGQVTAECIPTSKTITDADYYWKDYFGIIPDDAVEGGLDNTGNRTYIGQALSSSGHALLPGIIKPGKLKLLTSKDTNTSYMRILCSRYKKLEWKHIRNIYNSNLANAAELVVGGVENGMLVYIGRAMFQSQLLVGRVNVVPQEEGLKLSNEYGEEESFNQFEILTYF